jgi:SAM-dependent methyltransferase
MDCGLNVRMPPMVQSATAATKIDLGCGTNTREGFFGLDCIASPNTDYQLNLEVDSLPFRDDSIDYVYSSHTFEHLAYLPKVLKEIVRVCKHDATVEIWTPYGPSRDAHLPGHVHYLNETIWSHICYAHDRNYIGDVSGYLLWTETRYNLVPGILEELAAQKISIEFAINHMFDIAFEWGVFLTVKKDADRAPGSQSPTRVYGYGREAVVVPKVARRRSHS